MRYHWEEVGVRGEQYVYDAIGNREATGRYENSQGVWSEIHHYLSSSHPNQLRQREHIDSYNNRDTTFYAYNASGAMKNRTQGGSVEDFYHDNVQGLVKRYKRTNGTIVGEWQYRYSASGERELKREHQTGGVVAPKRWQYYLLGLGGEQLAVYEGHEVEQPTCGYFASQFTPQLFISASEYMVYGLGDVHNITSKPVDPTKNWNEYKVVDHLGSTRVVVDESGAIAGQYDYKPFGGILWQSAPTPRKNWIDKETDAENGLGDFGVRKYDDGLGRFTSIDPLWEKYRAWSPYNYSENNPLTQKDPNGKNPFAIWGAYELIVGAIALTTAAVASHELAKNPPKMPTFLQANPPGSEPTGNLPPVPPLATAHEKDPALAPKLELLPAHGDRATIMTASKSVNLPSWKTIQIDIGHIMSGHNADGDRVKQGKQGDLFPSNMTEEQVKKAVIEAYKGAKKLKTQGERVLVVGAATTSGLLIEMWVNVKKKTIETAYPVKDNKTNN